MVQEGIVEKGFVRFCSIFGGPFKADVSEELKGAAGFLDWDIEPELIVGAARFAMFASFIIFLGIVLTVFMVGVNPLPFIFMIPISVGVFLLMTEWPKSLAKQKAMSALAFAPYIITQTAISLKHKPNLEHALAFVAEYGEGLIAKDFKKMLWDLWAGKIKSAFDGLDGVAEKWMKFSQGFPRALYLIKSSFFEKDIGDKFNTLDKAIEIVLSDVTTKMKEYAHSLHMPTMVLFSIGTIVPLMLISLLPIVSFFGFDISAPTITVFLFLTIIACYIFSTIILKKRPATLAASGGFDDKKETARTAQQAGSSALVALILLSIPTLFYLLTLTGGLELYGPLAFISEYMGGFGLVWGVGIAVTIYAYFTSQKTYRTRKNANKLESQFIDSLFHIKNRLSDGRPMESALQYSADLMGKMDIAKFLKGIMNRMQRKSITLELAVKEEAPDSGLIRFVFKTLLESGKEGRKAAAQSAHVMYEYLTKINEIEKSLVTMLNKSLSMMKATVMFFAPIVCGIIVVLFEMINTTILTADLEFSAGYGLQGIFTPPAISPTVLQLVVGIYAIALNYVLIRYVSKIQYGSDDVAFKYDLAKAIPVTLIVFTATLIGARMMLL
jgi:hypothetical protein